jgi:hypothetical protein
MVALREWYDDQLARAQESFGFDKIQGSLYWSDLARTAYVSMSGNGASGYGEYSPGVDGSYIDPSNNRLYVDEALLWEALGSVLDPGLRSDPIGEGLLFAGSLGIAKAGIAAGTAITASAATATTPLVVIGSNPEYVLKAQSIDAKFFQVPTRIWETMTAAEQLLANQTFLDRAIARGSHFIIESSKSVSEYGLGLQMEIQYLLDHGYKFVKNGLKLIPR